MRNFLWSGKIEEKKIFTVIWGKSCLPKKEVGLGIRSLEATNRAFLKKMAWRILDEKCIMSELMRSRYLIHFRKIKSGYVTFSIQPPLRNCYYEPLGECIWIVGNDSTINVWHDNWIGYPISSKINIPQNIPARSTVGSFIVNKQWNLPRDLCL